MANHLLNTFCPRIDFDSYEDFAENFRIDVPENFNFAYDVVDEWARVEPDKRALLWCDDHDNERTFTFTDISRLSNRMANSFSAMGIGKGDVVMCILRRRWEYWVTAVALCKIGATIIHPAAYEKGHRLPSAKRPCQGHGLRRRRLRLRRGGKGAS